MDRPLILDRYRPLAELGAGGHGAVTLAFDTKMARRVAIKRLPLPVDRAGRPLARTGLAEARTAALLNHPSIVTVHEWDTDLDEAFIVMEDIDGASLADILDATGTPFDLNEAAAVISSVAAAVQFAHGNGVLHLDLKPANVLVTRDGRVKVADFGVSALTDASGRARGVAGTVGYMPPEQIRGQTLDERTDEWALASLAYEILTNANPFDADTAEGSLFRIEIAEVPAPGEFEPSLPPGVDMVLLAALAADPAERYQTASEFGDALLDHLGDAAAGHESLARIVDSLVADEDEGGDGRLAYPSLGLWDRLARYSGGFRRGGAAVVSGWLAWAGVSAFAPDLVPGVVAAVFAAVAAALAPGLGLAI
ncbi:MAG: serine/threonine-protein kinase, partial [Coriobacteriia bacterium]